MSKWRIIKTFIKMRWFSNFRTREELIRHQNRQIEKQFAYFAKYSPYFKEHEISTFKGMDKQFMMHYFDALNTIGLKKERALNIALASERNRDFTQGYNGFSVGLSSGTSGNRGLFVTSRIEQETWAGTILAKLLPKKKLVGHRVAFFLRADNQLYQTVKSPLLTFSYFDTFLPIVDHLERLEKERPTILIAPASMLVALSQARIKGHLSIQPEKIISVAELLEEQDEALIKAAFSVPIIHQVYQCTEGFLGCTCEYGNLHLNEDVVLIEKEYLDERRFIPIVTDYKRTSQPIIRYRLNDILVESKVSCPCGSVFQRIEKIEGREDDVFLFLSSTDEVVRIYPDFIRRCMLFVDDIGEYQVTQVDYTLIEVATQSLNETQRHQVIQEFQSLADAYHTRRLTVRFVAYSWDQSMKLKRIKRVFEEGESR